MLLGGAPNLTKIELINEQQDLIFEEKTRSYNQNVLKNYVHHKWYEWCLDMNNNFDHNEIYWNRERPEKFRVD